MKNSNKILMLAVLLTYVTITAFSQHGHKGAIGPKEKLGKVSKLFEQADNVQLAPNQKQKISLKINANESLVGEINFKEHKKNGNCIIGKVMDLPNTSFFLRNVGDSLAGHIII